MGDKIHPTHFQVPEMPWKKKEIKQYVTCPLCGYTTYRTSKPIEDRFWGKVNKRSDDECWEWQAYTDPKGYGRFYYTKPHKYMSAHKVSWVIHFGDIPKGMFVLHKCDNPKCVNPSHLFLGTHADNMKDMHNKGRNKGKLEWGETNPNVKLKDIEVDEIRSLYATGEYTYSNIAKLYNVSTSHIGAIIQGRYRNKKNGMG